jgi:hypothetical protein
VNIPYKYEGDLVHVEDGADGADLFLDVHEEDVLLVYSSIDQDILMYAY